MPFSHPVVPSNCLAVIVEASTGSRKIPSSCPAQHEEVAGWTWSVMWVQNELCKTLAWEGRIVVWVISCSFIYYHLLTCIHCVYSGLLVIWEIRLLAPPSWLSFYSCSFYSCCCSCRVLWLAMSTALPLVVHVRVVSMLVVTSVVIILCPGRCPRPGHPGCLWSSSLSCFRSCDPRLCHWRSYPHKCDYWVCEHLLFHLFSMTIMVQVVVSPFTPWGTWEIACNIYSTGVFHGMTAAHCTKSRKDLVTIAYCTSITRVKVPQVFLNLPRPFHD